MLKVLLWLCALVGLCAWDASPIGALIATVGMNLGFAITDALHRRHHDHLIPSTPRSAR